VQRGRWAWITVLVILALASCSTSPTATRPNTFGNVTGLLQVTSIGPNQPIPGSVTLISNSGPQYTVRVPKDGKFRFRVPTGMYTAGGSSPEVRVATVTNAEARCYDLTGYVHVVTGSTAHAVVTCSGFQSVGPVP
jgi:hypothetical protein